MVRGVVDRSVPEPLPNASCVSAMLLTYSKSTTSNILYLFVCGFCGICPDECLPEARPKIQQHPMDFALLGIDRVVPRRAGNLFSQSIGSCPVQCALLRGGVPRPFDTVQKLISDEARACLAWRPGRLASCFQQAIRNWTCRGEECIVCRTDTRPLVDEALQEGLASEGPRSACRTRREGSYEAPFVARCLAHVAACRGEPVRNVMRGPATH